MDNNYCVYMHRNKSNGKIYIGMTGDIQRRWHNCGVEYVKRGHLFGEAVQKYGWDGFDHIILYDGLDKETACQIEMECIARYKSNATKYDSPAYGYNLTDGGEHVCGCIRTGRLNSFYGKHHSDKTKEILSAVKKGRFVGERSALYGIPKTDLQKQMISESLKEWYRNNDSPHNIPVLCVTDGKIFKSVTEASEYYEILKSDISACCLGKRKTAKGLVFTYSLDGTLPQYKEDRRSSDEVRERARQCHSIPVLCVETGIIYPSGKDAALALGHPNGKSSVAKCCKNGKTAWGYHWRHADVINGGDED